ncbi:unnamed protein product [Phytomonas sp. Hart1]|nr:unnamed protein product [Phytomonas sp. Hart1]|eukprot:CCW69336.1 unnamed protein product [Phytomonas sp. isolate Hart1]
MNDLRYPSTGLNNDETWIRNNESIARLKPVFTQHTLPSLINTQGCLSPLRLMNSSKNRRNEIHPLKPTSSIHKLPLFNPVRVLNADDKPREWGGAWRGRYSVRPVVYMRFGRSAAYGDKCCRCGGNNELPFLFTSSQGVSSPCEVLTKALIPRPSRPSAPPPATYYQRDRTRASGDTSGDDEETHMRSIFSTYCSACLRSIKSKQVESTERPRFYLTSGWKVFFERDEYVARERIMEEWLNFLLTIPLPAHFGYPSSPTRDNIYQSGILKNGKSNSVLHRKSNGFPQAHLRSYTSPALSLAIERLSAREFLARRQLLDEEEDRFNKHFKNLGRYLRYLAPTGSTTRIYGFLRAWIARHRAQKIVRFNQHEQLKNHEDAARRYLVSEIHIKRHQLFVELVEMMEKIDRVCILRIQLITSYSHGIVSIKLAEQVARFPVLFGCLMSQARKFSLVNAHTAFCALTMQEEHHRHRIEREEDQERVEFLTIEQQEHITDSEEQFERRMIQEQEAVKYWKLAWQVFQLEVYHAFRDVEQYEAATRNTEFQWKKKSHGSYE